MLYGVRGKLQLDLVRQGYDVLVATPYGPDWYRYLMRRLAERPANVLFIARNLIGASRAGARRAARSELAPVTAPSARPAV